MNYIKLACTISLVALSFSSCKNEENKEAQVEKNKESKTAKDSLAAEKARYADNGLDEQTTMGQPVMLDRYEIDWDDVEADPKLKLDIDNWNDLKTFSTSMKSLSLKEVPNTEIIDYITQLEQKANKLQNTIPQSLLTEEVQEDIKDVIEEVADLKAITTKYGADEDRISNQVEELFEAYADLSEELKETATKKGKSILDKNTKI